MIGFIIGMIFGGVATYLVLGKKIFSPKKTVPKYSRRGLYSNSYSISQHGIKKHDVTVQFEIGELESTDTMSKVEVISCITNRSQHNKESEKKEFIGLINNSWIRSNDIQWITTIASQRNDKIDQILS
jgi:hypothetical protein